MRTKSSNPIIQEIKHCKNCHFLRMGRPFSINMTEKTINPEEKRIYCKHGCLPRKRYLDTTHKDMKLAETCSLYYFDK